MQAYAGPLAALIGLIVGLVEYKLVGGVVIAALRRTNRSETPAEHADYEQRIRILRIVLLIMTVGAMPIAGYFVGRALFG